MVRERRGDSGSPVHCPKKAHRLSSGYRTGVSRRRSNPGHPGGRRTSPKDEARTRVFGRTAWLPPACSETEALIPISTTRVTVRSCLLVMIAVTLVAAVLAKLLLLPVLEPPNQRNSPAILKYASESITCRNILQLRHGNMQTIGSDSEPCGRLNRSRSREVPVYDGPLFRRRRRGGRAAKCSGCGSTNSCLVGGRIGGLKRDTATGKPWN